jgi:hypothetical protein
MTAKKVQTKKTDNPGFESDKKGFGDQLKKVLKIFLAVLIIIGGGILTWYYLPEFLLVLKGVIGIAVILIGLIVLAIAWTD